MTSQTKYRKYDSESDYYAMGYRMYSAEFGRFLTVDPLFEAMPRHSPYHYSFNSPMFWSDPSGLAPKVFEETIQELLEKKWAMEGTIDLIFSDPRNRADYVSGLAMESKNLKSPRLGAWWSMKILGLNGFGIPNGQKIEYKYQVHIPTSNGIVTMDVNIYDDKNGFSDQFLLDELVAGINKILEAEPDYFDSFIGKNYTINLGDADRVLNEYNSGATEPEYIIDEPIGGFFNGASNTFWFATEGISESIEELKYNRGKYYLQWYSVLAHEFAHAIHYNLLGANTYKNDYEYWQKEHYAIKRANYIRDFFGDPQRSNKLGKYAITTWYGIKHIFFPRSSK